jgi:hypothetical protein
MFLKDEFFFEKTPGGGLLGRIKRPEKIFIAIIANEIKQASVLPLKAIKATLVTGLAIVVINCCKAR